MDPNTAPVLPAPLAKAAGERSLSPIGTATASRICCSARMMDFFYHLPPDEAREYPAKARTARKPK
jgi:hypothetical protein